MIVTELHCEKIKDTITNTDIWKIISENKMWLNPDAISFFGTNVVFPDYCDVCIGGRGILIKSSFEEVLEMLEESRLAPKMKKHLEDLEE